MGVMRSGPARAASVPVVEGGRGLAFPVVLRLSPPVPSGIPAWPRRCRLCPSPCLSVRPLRFRPLVSGCRIRNGFELSVSRWILSWVRVSCSRRNHGEPFAPQRCSVNVACCVMSGRRHLWGSSGWPCSWGHQLLEQPPVGSSQLRSHLLSTCASYSCSF